MKKILFVTWITVLFGGSCKQDAIRPTTVDGQVINRVTGMPMSNILVFVEASVSDGSLSGTRKNVYRGRTDANGRFYATFNEGDYPSSRVTSIDSDTVHFFPSVTGFTTNNDITLTAHQDNKIIHYVAPEDYLALGVHNVNYFDDRDSISLYYGNKAINWGFDTQFAFTGNFHHDSGKGDIPMGWIHFDWDVTRQGITTYHHDSVWCKAGALTLYQINY